VTQDITAHLSDHHWRELETESAIDPTVIEERGYRTIGRPNVNDERPRHELQGMSIPGWALREDSYFPGLLIPLYGPDGRQVSRQFKPKNAVPVNGKPVRYASVKGRANVLDVHPRWSLNGAEVVPAIRDTARPLWITEGVKKADSLTSRGCVTVALSGVFNWRGQLGTLGDWEDVALRGRTVVVCFDADTLTKAPVAAAMSRLGRWLRSKGVAKVHYLVVPAMVNDHAVKGVDDFFAAGGTLEELRTAARDRPPAAEQADVTYTDARMADRAHDELCERFAWCAELGWLELAGGRWRYAPDGAVVEAWRQTALAEHAAAADDMKSGADGAAVRVDGWRSHLSASRLHAVAGLARNTLAVRWEVLDADPLAINTPTGLVDLDTGEVRPVESGDYPTKITGASFDPDARSQLWDAFLQRILPDEAVRGFVQRLLGYSLLGVVREHIMPIFTGTGRNGKGTLRDAVLAAYGDYAAEVSPEILMHRHNPLHGTFTLELRGRRLVFCSETEKDRAFAEATMRRLVGGDRLQGNRMAKDPIEFQPSHTLVMLTNYLPSVTSIEPATWDRIRVVPFDVYIPEGERDGRLPERLREPPVQAAVMAWLYDGYRQWSQRGLDAPAAVMARTENYRSDSDTYGRFLADRVQLGGEATRTTSSDLYRALAAWWRTEIGNDVPGNRELTRELARRNLRPVKSHGQMVFRGVHLISEEEEDGHGDPC
jgi:P4 family phage/plasmid primase-like protien